MAGDPLLKAFERQVHRRPDAPLVVSQTRRATASDVAALALNLATRLDGSVGDRGTTVAMLSPNGPGFLAALVGILRAGCTPVLIDEGVKRAELRDLIRRLGIGAVVRCGRGWPSSAEDFVLEAGALADCQTLGASNPAVIKLTSATTGQPVGIATPAEALLADDENLTKTMGIRTSDRLLAMIPFSHSYGLSSLVIASLVRGMTVVVPDGGPPFGPLEAAAECGASILPTVPAYLTALVHACPSAEALGSLRLVLSAGAKLSPETARRFRERFGRSVHVFYGATECGGITYDREGTAGERDTVGEPVEGVRLSLDPIVGSFDDSAGRVVVRSAAVAASSGCFVSDDVAVWEGTELRLVGRAGEVINFRGRKVSSAEIERVIAESPGVEEVKVVGVTRSGSDDQYIRAIVGCPRGSTTTARLFAWCRERLSAHKVPRSIVLVDRIPRNRRGKIDLAALSDPDLRVVRGISDG